MKLLCQAVDGKVFTADSEEVREVLPFTQAMRSPMLREPFTGIMQYELEPLPLTGALPANGVIDHWVMVFADHGIVVRRVPDMQRDISLEDIQAEGLAPEQPVTPAKRAA